MPGSNSPLQLSSNQDALSPVVQGSINGDSTATRRPDRPCDACRRRKSRCVINYNAATCVLCEFHRQECTFVEGSQARKRKHNGVGEDPELAKRRYGVMCLEVFAQTDVSGHIALPIQNLAGDCHTAFLYAPTMPLTTMPTSKVLPSSRRHLVCKPDSTADT
jgi:hypothetical protein